MTAPLARLFKIVRVTPLECLGVVLAGLCSGTLLAGAFPPWNQAWLGWVGLVPLCLGARWLSPAASGLAGYLAGLVFFGGTLGWIGVVTPVGATLLVLYLALYFAGWAAFMAWLWPRQGPLTTVRNLAVAGTAAAAWIVLEWLRGWLFSGFGWNGLGVALHDHLPLAMSARLGGVHLLSGLLVLGNLLLALTVFRFIEEVRGRQPMRTHADILGGVLLVSLLFSYGFREAMGTQSAWEAARERNGSVRFALLQPNIQQDHDQPATAREVLTTLVSLSELALTLRAEVIVWPESPTGDLYVDSPLVADAVRHLMENARGSLPLLVPEIVVGALRREGGRYYNAAQLHRLVGEGEPETRTYDKLRLVPFGEFIPGAEAMPWLRWLVPFQIDFTAGNSPAQWSVAQGRLTALPLICFEDTLPRHLRAVGGSRVDLLLNLTNDGWFGDSVGAEMHAANARLRAIEGDVPLVRTTNTGVTLVVSPSGRVTHVLEVEGRRVGVQGLITADLPLYASSETPYERWGDWIVGFAALAVGLGAWSGRRRVH